MSEVEEKDLEQKSLQQLFADSQETLEEAQARKSAEENIYGNFLKWYQDTYPEEWKRIKMKTK